MSMLFVVASYSSIFTWMGDSVPDGAGGVTLREMLRPRLERHGPERRHQYAMQQREDEREADAADHQRVHVGPVAVVRRRSW